MIGLLQRVSGAKVEVAGANVAEIKKGILILVGVERGDTTAQADRLLERLLTYRVFPDADDKMNLSVGDIAGAVLLVPQFTLAADTESGNRPSFSTAAPPEEGARLFEYLLAQARKKHAVVAAGRFGADMQVTLTNDGPVTFWLRAKPPVPDAERLRRRGLLGPNE